MAGLSPHHTLTQIREQDVQERVTDSAWRNAALRQARRRNDRELEYQLLDTWTRESSLSWRLGNYRKIHRLELLFREIREDWPLFIEGPGSSFRTCWSPESATLWLSRCAQSIFEALDHPSEHVREEVSSVLRDQRRHPLKVTHTINALINLAEAGKFYVSGVVHVTSGPLPGVYGPASDSTQRLENTRLRMTEHLREVLLNKPTPTQFSMLNTRVCLEPGA